MNLKVLTLFLIIVILIKHHTVSLTITESSIKMSNTDWYINANIGTEAFTMGCKNVITGRLVALKKLAPQGSLSDTALTARKVVLSGGSRPIDNVDNLNKVTKELLDDYNMISVNDIPIINKDNLKTATLPSIVKYSDLVKGGLISVEVLINKIQQLVSATMESGQMFDIQKFDLLQKYIVEDHVNSSSFLTYPTFILDTYLADDQSHLWARNKMNKKYSDLSGFKLTQLKFHIDYTSFIRKSYLLCLSRNKALDVLDAKFDATVLYFVKPFYLYSSMMQDSTISKNNLYTMFQFTNTRNDYVKKMVLNTINVDLLVLLQQIRDLAQTGEDYFGMSAQEQSQTKWREIREQSESWFLSFFNDKNKRFEIIDPCNVIDTLYQAKMDLVYSPETITSLSSTYKLKAIRLLSNYQVIEEASMIDYTQKFSMTKTNDYILELNDDEYEKNMCSFTTREEFVKMISMGATPEYSYDKSFDCVYTLRLPGHLVTQLVSAQEGAPKIIMKDQTYFLITDTMVPEGDKCVNERYRKITQTNECKTNYGETFESVSSSPVPGSIVKYVGHSNTCLVKLFFKKHYLCYDSICTITIVADLYHIEVNTESGGPTFIRYSLNGKEISNIKHIGTEKMTKKMPISHDGTFNLVVRCNKEVATKDYQRDHSSYCRHYAGKSVVSSIAYAYCYYSHQIILLVIYFIGSIIFFMLQEFIAWLCSLFGGSTYLLYTCLSCRNCENCHHPKGLCCHKCKTCYYCAEKVHCPRYTEEGQLENKHICDDDDIKDPIERMKYLNSGCLIFFNSLIWVIARLNFVTCIVLFLIFFIKSVDGDQMLDLNELKRQGFQEVSSRYNPETHIRISLSDVSTLTTADGLSSKIKGTIFASPGSTAGFAYKVNGVDQTLDIRIDNTFRTMQLSLLYETCEHTTNIVESSGCRKTSQECLSGLEDKLSKKGIHKNNTIFNHRSKDSIGGWQCSCAGHNTAYACAICYITYDLGKPCWKVMKAQKNQFSVNVCIYVNGLSYCKPIQNGLIEGTNKMAFALGSELRQKDIGTKYAVNSDGEIRTGSINDLRSYGMQFGNTQRLMKNSIINYVPAVDSNFQCMALSPARYSILTCVKDLTGLFKDLSVVQDARMNSQGNLVFEGENLGMMHFQLIVPFQKFDVIMDEGSVKDFKILNAKGCHSCSSGAWVEFEIQVTKKGNYRIDCSPPLLRPIHNINNIKTILKLSLFYYKETFEMTCTVGDVKRSFTVKLDDPNDHIIDVKDLIKKHQILLEDNCKGFFSCATIWFKKLAMGSIHWVFIKIASFFGALIVFAIIIVVSIKLLKRICSGETSIIDEYRDFKKEIRKRGYVGQGIKETFNNWRKPKKIDDSLPLINPKKTLNNNKNKKPKSMKSTSIVVYDEEPWL